MLALLSKLMSFLEILQVKSQEGIKMISGIFHTFGQHLQMLHAGEPWPHALADACVHDLLEYDDVLRLLLLKEQWVDEKSQLASRASVDWSLSAEGRP